MMNDPIAYHVVFCTHGYWLPNDPRGSSSTEVRYEPLLAYGKANPVPAEENVARVAHDRATRVAAKQQMRRPEVILNGHQALSIANGFARQIAKSKYVIFACSILPQHVHLVVQHHAYSIEQVVRLLRQAGTLELLADMRHPFAAQRNSKGRLPSIWAQDFWKVFLYSENDIVDRIKYVEENPSKEGKRPQEWSFVTSFAKAT